jgi:hypothetical protein
METVMASETVHIAGVTLNNVHPSAACFGRSCTIHSPSDHSMRKFPLHWRDDRGIFERICVHGIGHPDPDQFEYWRIMHQEYERVHGCDGCCG